MRSVSRKYHSCHLEFRFIEELDSELDPRPESLSSNALKSLELERHLTSKYLDIAKKLLKYFERLHENMQKKVTVLIKIYHGR
ncbi:hypothetical protein TNCT_509281 [Trichonephila clavata]|uniref:Uncharacterized protein n=1 Tax=Trichonephila clavata TaxID=2740835 RepID=A0A8X6FKE3_TRICU|nr:hypothetical protein TNCT_509281 [Trichonephila clavata]